MNWYPYMHNSPLIVGMEVAAFGSSIILGSSPTGILHALAFASLLLDIHAVVFCVGAASLNRNLVSADEDVGWSMLVGARLTITCGEDGTA
ncbi:hypothetical protein RRF57_008539 [Xylaria bambusicola]|uniref:Uncharacterized protein n=1 Tax=Xylaria bambusicola TaxID=326684 RepID=A0AAN7Z0T2_9PEZI